MADLFSENSSGLASPGEHAAAVTPNDGADLSYSARALYIGTAGALVVDTVGGETVTFANVPVGWFPVRVKRVRATGTAASDIVAVW